MGFTIKYDGIDFTIKVLQKLFEKIVWKGSRNYFGGTRGVMVIVVGNGHGGKSSNPRRDWLHFTSH